MCPNSITQREIELFEPQWAILEYLRCVSEDFDPGARLGRTMGTEWPFCNLLICSSNFFVSRSNKKMNAQKSAS